MGGTLQQSVAQPPPSDGRIAAVYRWRILHGLGQPVDSGWQRRLDPHGHATAVALRMGGVFGDVRHHRCVDADTTFHWKPHTCVIWLKRVETTS